MNKKPTKESCCKGGPQNAFSTKDMKKMSETQKNTIKNKK